MDHSRHRTSEDRLEEFSRAVIRWILGPGLLSLHVGVFLVSVLVLLLWNFARTPSDVWVDEPLRRWGLVVVFHITAVAAGWAAWRLMRFGDGSSSSGRLSGGTSRTNRPSTNAPRGAQGAATFVPAQSARYETEVVPASGGEQAKQWLRDSVRLVREVVEDAPSQASQAHPDRTLPGSVPSATVGPGVTEWGAIFIRRTREMMASARDHVSPVQQTRAAKLDQPLNGVGLPAPNDPSRTWPGGPAPDQSMSPPPVNGAPESWPASGNTAGHAASPESTWGSHRNGRNGAAEILPGFTPVEPNERAVDARETNDAADATATEAARWTWVESAAAAWMTRRENDDPPAEPSAADSLSEPPPTDDAPSNP